jgi:DNA-binding phage protein
MSFLTVYIASANIIVGFAAFILIKMARRFMALRSSAWKLCSVSSIQWRMVVSKGLSLYKSYSFRDKDPVIDEMRTLVNDSHKSYRDIHEASGVSVSTMYNWFEGTTKRPQYATVMAVVYALGYKAKFVRSR